MSEDHEAQLQSLKMDYAQLGGILKGHLRGLPIPVGFELGENVEATGASLIHTADIIADMPVAAAVAEAMQSALMHFASATYALAWFAVNRGGDAAAANVRFLLLESAKALATAALGQLPDGSGGEVQG